MSDDHTDLVLEDMNSKFDAVIELVTQMRDDMKQLAKQSDLQEVKADIKTIKAAVTDLSQQVEKHEQQLASL
ncbi:MAG: hypothetical protein V4702_02980 [Patescibacteria group bacterium]